MISTNRPLELIVFACHPSMLHGRRSTADAAMHGRRRRIPTSATTSAKMSRRWLQFSATTAFERSVPRRGTTATTRRRIVPLTGQWPRRMMTMMIGLHRTLCATSCHDGRGPQLVMTLMMNGVMMTMLLYLMMMIQNQICYRCRHHPQYHQRTMLLLIWTTSSVMTIRGVRADVALFCF